MAADALTACSPRSEATPARPDFLIVGAPKAGSTALHDALAAHPGLYASPVKEPKYYLTDGGRPSRRHHRGPGDAHSSREWIWRPSDYARLFAAAPAGALRFESTPFYLWDRAAHRRIAAELPEAKIVAVIRDPVDRAFSNWTHLRADGLEPERDFRTACALEPIRIRDGWAPFWRYVDLGRYGEQLRDLYSVVDPARVHVVRYRTLVDEPARVLDDVCRFLDVDTGVVDRLPEANVGRWAADRPRDRALRGIVRAGAAAGSWAPPKVWRAAERRLLPILQRDAGARPRLDPADRAALVEEFRADNALLCSLAGAEYAEWLRAEGGGTFTTRRGN